MRVGRFTAKDSNDSDGFRQSELEAQLQIADALERMDR